MSKKKYFKVRFKTDSTGTDVVTLSNLPIERLEFAKKLVGAAKKQKRGEFVSDLTECHRCSDCPFEANLWDYSQDCDELFPDDIKRSTLEILE